MKARNYLFVLALILIVSILVVISLTKQVAVDSVDINANSLPVPRPAAVPGPTQMETRTTPASRPAVVATSAPVPVPAPKPRMNAGATTSVPTSEVASAVFPALLMLVGGCGLLALLGWRLSGPGLRLSKTGVARLVTALLLGLLLLGCRAQEPDPLPPDAYLDNALSWLEANAVTAGEVNWETVRAEARALAPSPQTTADTYPAIEYAQAQLDDDLAFLRRPGHSVWDRLHIGLTAIYPQNIVVEVETGSPASGTEIQVGDRVLLVEGAPPVPSSYRSNHVNFLVAREDPRPLTIRLERENRQFEVTLTPDEYTNEQDLSSRTFPLGERRAGYFDLRTDVGSRMYPTRAQAALKAADGPDTCGWVIDLRRNLGGNLWTYFAALGPLLGEGELGGFEYADGSREMWSYEDGKVFWAGEEREEGYVRGRIYRLQRPSPPVALLTGSLTEAAGELMVVAFQGWGNVRTFGETTQGIPNLVLHTALSDGALLYVSGARGFDRQGIVYNGPIIPDEAVATDWQRFGRAGDPVITAALNWLAVQPACNS